MPSIEIVCVGQLEPLDFSALPFAVESSPKLVSQRTPKPLFQAEFDALQGCIYYLGSPARRNAPIPDCYLAAVDLLAQETGTEWWNGIFFAPEFVPPLQTLLRRLLEASPVGQILFTSDYQFGPDAKRYKRPLKTPRFWALHDARRLRMNALYRLKV